VCRNRLVNGRCEKFIGSNLTQFVRHAPQASIRAVCWPRAKSFAIARLPVDRPRADSGIGGIQLLNDLRWARRFSLRSHITVKLQSGIALKLRMRLGPQ